MKYSEAKMRSKSYIMNREYRDSYVGSKLNAKYSANFNFIYFDIDSEEVDCQAVVWPELRQGQALYKHGCLQTWVVCAIQMNYL